MSRRRPLALLALVPASGLSIAIPFVNRLEPRIFGLPFILAWIIAWWLLTAVLMYIIYRSEIT